MSDVFSSPEFEAKYTYHGHDLGATWSPVQTVFKLWAPTAEAVQLRLYQSGDPNNTDLIEKMKSKRLVQKSKRDQK